MATNLGARASNQPLPMGLSARVVPSEFGALAWPPSGNFISGGPGSGGTANQVGPYNRPERFWLHGGASIIARNLAATWERYDCVLRLVTDPGVPINDLNGVNFTQKAHSGENHADGWMGTSIEALFFCEANINYYIQLLSASSSPNVQYYQSAAHMNMWAYTAGEGVY